MQELYDKLANILTRQFGVDESALTPGATFESLELDSLDLVEITLVVDDELGARIPDDKLEEITTVQDAVDVVAELLVGQQPQADPAGEAVPA
jgi:acyl carrier protein